MAMTETEKLQRAFDFNIHGFDLATFKALKVQSLEGPTRSSRISTIHSSSGYLAILDPTELRGWTQAANNQEIPSPPSFLEGPGYICFRNKWGDGVFDVISEQGKFYVITESPINMDPAVNRMASGEVDGWFKQARLEGLVGIGGGCAAIVDPGSHPLRNVNQRRLDHGEFFTILNVGVGNFEIRFINRGNRLEIAKINA
jgi:hypothetical protein